MAVPYKKAVSSEPYNEEKSTSKFTSDLGVARQQNYDLVHETATTDAAVSGQNLGASGVDGEVGGTTFGEFTYMHSKNTPTNDDYDLS